MSDLSAKGIDVNVSDLTGFGKVAKAIPPEVYARTAATTLSTFEKLTAPITETTAGFGRYIRQKFDSMVEVERALAAFTLEQAMEQLRAAGKLPRPPEHPKAFVRSLEEASRETDPLLHAMWTRLLASQLTEHPASLHFMEILSNFSPEDAQLLLSLGSRPSNPGQFGIQINTGIHFPAYRWIHDADDPKPKPWTPACTMLCHFALADVDRRLPKPRTKCLLLFRTHRGAEFLNAVGAI